MKYIWIQHLKNHLNALSLFLRGVRGKFATFVLGQSSVTRNCQIPNIRELYRDLGLNSRFGTFVEIGGYDGHSYSNTSFLSDQGWRGIYVEPIPDFCKLIRFRHALNNVVVEPVAVNESNHTTNIYLMGTLTTTNQDTKDAYADIPWSERQAETAKTVQVECDSIANILARNNVPENLELMVVDVEGGEEPIISALLASAWRPKVLVVELCDIHPDFSGHEALQLSARRTRKAILDSGYTDVYSDPINTVFLLRQ